MINPFDLSVLLNNILDGSGYYLIKFIFHRAVTYSTHLSILILCFKSSDHFQTEKRSLLKVGPSSVQVRIEEVCPEASSILFSVVILRNLYFAGITQLCFASKATSFRMFSPKLSDFIEMGKIGTIVRNDERRPKKSSNF